MLCIGAISQHAYGFLDAVRRLTEVNYGMAVSADRAQVLDWVNDVLLANGCQRSQVMDVNIAVSGATVCGAETETTNETIGAVVIDAFLAGYGISLEGTDLYGEVRPFNERYIGAEFFLE